MQTMRRQQFKTLLFRYDNYRNYLRDWYEEHKKAGLPLTFRSFSKKAGFQSPNFFKLVMDGQRNLTEESLPKFVLGLGLNKQEQEFFRNLVLYNQAKAHAERDFFYQRLLQSRKFSQLKPVEKQQYEYYSTWYHPIIRELIASKDFDGTPEWIAARLQPTVSPLQVEKSIELLGQLKFIEKKSDGKWRQSSTLLSTGAEVNSVVVVNYHKKILDLTKELLDVVPQSERDVSCLTLGVAHSRIAELKKKIGEFRQEILKLVSTDVEPEAVVQLNIQMVPVTRTGVEGGKV